MPTDPKYLQNFSCFESLSRDQLQAVAEITNAVCYPSGYVLFEEGNPGDRLFFLMKGSVEVFYQIGEETRVNVDTVKGEDIVGCSVLVEPFTYTATEKSLTEVEVLEIDAAGLRNLMQNDRDLGFLIQKYVIDVLMDRILDLRLETA
ncbi:MAG: Crp/Fnr family transcriptional regulator [Anaerolineales bacterium]|jgi:CRP/FNR family cyclic AMP-dependent transcriptional regulator